jgi:deoxyribose-phosphate aldolase
MYKDVTCYNCTDTSDDVRETLFSAIDKELSGISIFAPLITSIKDFLVDGLTLSCPIDYPYGVSDTAIRTHATLAALRKGANAIDLVASNILLFNKQANKFCDDVDSVKKVCDENGSTLRLMLDYRLYDYTTMIKIGNLLKELKIEYIIPATGRLIDAWDDNLAISIEMSNKTGLKVITNGNIWKRSQYDLIAKSGVFGVRFNNAGALKNIFK